MYTTYYFRLCLTRVALILVEIDISSALALAMPPRKPVKKRPSKKYTHVSDLERKYILGMRKEGIAWALIRKISGRGNGATEACIKKGMPRVRRQVAAQVRAPKKIKSKEGRRLVKSLDDLLKASKGRREVTMGTRVCDAVPAQCPLSARSVPAQCPHSARCKFPLDLRMSRCQRIGGPRHPTSTVVWPFLIVIYSGHCAGTVRALSGHCAGIVRALCGHCSARKRIER